MAGFRCQVAASQRRNWPEPLQHGKCRAWDGLWLVARRLVVLWTSAVILGQGIGELCEMAETRLREAYGV